MKKTFILILISIFCFSCSKKNPTPCTAGAGGNVNLIAFPQHHAESFTCPATYRDTAYLKYNTSDYPGSNPALYDVTFISDAGSDSISMKGLKCGNYYVYIVAFHTALQHRIMGGMPVSITGTGGETDIIVALAE